MWTHFKPCNENSLIITLRNLCKTFCEHIFYILSRQDKTFVENVLGHYIKTSHQNVLQTFSRVYKYISSKHCANQTQTFLNHFENIFLFAGGAPHFFVTPYEDGPTFFWPPITLCHFFVKTPPPLSQALILLFRSITRRLI